MSRKQRTVLVIGFLLVLGMFIFPPWRVIYDIPGEKGKFATSDIPKGHVEHSGGYRFLLGQQDSRVDSYVMVNGEETLAYVTTRIDYYRLAAQIAAVILLMGIAYLILRPTNRPS